MQDHAAIERRGAGPALLLALVLIAGAAACGSDAGSAAAQTQVTPSDRVYSVDDFLAVGFKKSKQYDVEGLPDAVDARFGFWGPNAADRKDYELRFYASHEDAVASGTALAEEATGEDAKLLERDNPTWTEGLKQRRMSASVPLGVVGQVGIAPSAKYADYAIFGNVVMLCEGADSGQSLERCRLLIDALQADGGD